MFNKYIKKPFSLIGRSLQMDLQFLSIASMPWRDKFSFIIIKYAVLGKNFLFGFKAGKSYAKISGKKYFYEDKFGLAFLQVLFIENAFLANFISRDSVIIDVGGNIGQFNFFCKNFLKASRVYSFEPIKNSFDILKLNSPQDVYHAAVSNSTTVDMFVPNNSLLASSIHVNKSDVKETVRGLRVDEIDPIKNEKRISLLKIDTEGSEIDVLRASEETLKRAEYVLIEASVARRSAGDVLDLIVYLKNINPNIKLAWIGQFYKLNGSIDAVDLLFRNKAD